MSTDTLPVLYGKHVVNGVTIVGGHAGNVRWRSDCARCTADGETAFAPDHDAMPDCQSGHRDHCTCDRCF